MLALPACLPGPLRNPQPTVVQIWGGRLACEGLLHDNVGLVDWCCADPPLHWLLLVRYLRSLLRTPHRTSAACLDQLQGSLREIYKLCVSSPSDQLQDRESCMNSTSYASAACLINCQIGNPQILPTVRAACRQYWLYQCRGFSDTSSLGISCISLYGYIRGCNLQCCLTMAAEGHGFSSCRANLGWHFGCTPVY
jgi:hypothetical protein